MLTYFNNCKISFPKLAQNSECPDDPLYPLVIESVSDQSFLIREKVPAAKFIKRNNIPFKSLSKFQEYLKQKLDLQKCSLKFDRRSMNFDKLVIIVKDALSLPEFFNPYNEALKFLENENVEMNQDIKDKIDEDMVIIEQMALQILEKTYRYGTILWYYYFFR